MLANYQVRKEGDNRVLTVDVGSYNKVVAVFSNGYSGETAYGAVCNEIARCGGSLYNLDTLQYDVGSLEQVMKNKLP